MKNVLQRQLKRVIFMRYEEFKELVTQLCGKDSYVDIDLEGIEFYGPNGDSNSVIEALNEYYDVSISSIHIDDYVEEPGVWICYKQNKKDQIVKLEFFDPDWDDNVDGRPGVVEVYYLKNPDETKLAELKEKVEHRFDAMQKDDITDDELAAAEEFVDNIYDVNGYLLKLVDKKVIKKKGVF